MQTTRLFLIRHGQVEGFGEPRYNGQSDIALTVTGRGQSERICARLSDEVISGVYSSDLERSAFCARLIAADHQLTATTDRALRELHVGHWQGRTWTDLQEAYPREWQSRLQDLVNFRVPGGESFRDAANRVRPFIQGLIGRHRGENIVLVGHGGVNRIILLDAIGADLRQAFAIEQDYGCLNIVDYADVNRGMVKLMNCTAHLG